jgi:hypothetical protein
VLTHPTTPVALTEPDASPKWIEMTRSGVHVSRRVGGGPAAGPETVELTEADIESAVRGFYALKADGAFPGGLAPVGVDHAELAAALAAVTGGEPLVGDLAGFDEVRAERNDEGGLSLMGLHTYTDIGRSAVVAKALRGYSSDLAPPGLAQKRDGTTVDEWVPFGGTLTNRPFVRAMQPIAASEALIKTNQRENPMTDVLTGILGLSDGASDADRIKAITALSEQASKVPTLESKVVALTDALDTTTADRDAAKAEVVALVEWKQARLGADAASVGRCSTKEIPEYLKAVAALGEDHAHKVYPAGRVTVAPPAQTEQRTDEGGPESASDRYQRIKSLALADGKTLAEAVRLARAQTDSDLNDTYRAGRVTAEA